MAGELTVASHIESTQRWIPQLGNWFPFYSKRTTTHGMVLPTVSVAFHLHLTLKSPENCFHNDFKSHQLEKFYQHRQDGVSRA